jgi:formate/nitrite transporter FocA (FNT family)
MSANNITSMSKLKTSSVLFFSVRKLAKRIKVFVEGQRARQIKVIVGSNFHGTILKTIIGFLTTERKCVAFI